MNFANLIKQVKQGNDLAVEEMQDAISQMMDGTVPDAEMGDLLLALKEKGESASEVVGAAQAMRSKMQVIESNRTDLVDTCGTGGDGSGTFNISTAAAIVAAGAGIAIAKHGNRKVSSKSGSADVLSQLGVNVAADHAVVEKCLNEVGLCFCFAPLFHSSVKNVMAVRQSLGVPTVFNMLGPLCNPAGAAFQTVGVGKPWQRELIALSLQQLGTTKSVVLHGKDGICEISNADQTEISVVTPDGVESHTWSPADFGRNLSSREDILASDPDESARRIRSVLEGEESAATDIVVMNAAAAIWLGKPEKSLMECAEIARKSINSGAATEKLEHLANVSQEK